MFYPIGEPGGLSSEDRKGAFNKECLKGGDGGKIEVTTKKNHQDLAKWGLYEKQVFHQMLNPT